MHQYGEHGQRDQRQQQRDGCQVGGVEQRDDGDRQPVINHREGEQEGSRRGREMGADHGENREGEGDVSGVRDRPALQSAVPQGPG